MHIKISTPQQAHIYSSYWRRCSHIKSKNLRQDSPNLIEKMMVMMISKNDRWNYMHKTDFYMQ